MAVDCFPVHYGFVDISTHRLKSPMPSESTIAELKEKNRVLVTKLRERFYYRVRDMYLVVLSYLTDVS